MTTKKPSNQFSEAELKALKMMSEGRMLSSDDFLDLGMNGHNYRNNFLVKCHRNGILLYEEHDEDRSTHGKVLYGMAESHRVLSLDDEYLGF